MLQRILLTTVLATFSLTSLQAAPSDKAELEAWAETKSQVILEFDEQDNLVRVSGTEKRGEGEPFNDADAAMLAEIPTIKVFEWNNPRITAEGVQSIGTMEQLEVLTLWLGGGIDDIDAGAILALDSLKNLRKLDLKHSFSVKGEPVIQKMTTFPHLQWLTVDTVHSDAEVVEFLQKNPTITELELHRTTMSNEDFAKVTAALPDLVYLELKPLRRAEGIVNNAGLASIKKLTKLQKLTLSHSGWKPLEWEGGVEHLVGVLSLRLLQTNAVDAFEGSPLEKLAEKRPDLMIRMGQDVWHQGEKKSSKEVDFDAVTPAVKWEGRNPGT
jgi:hypothetical protein